MKDEAKSALSGIWARLKEYKYVGLVLLLGLVLILLPAGEGESEAAPELPPAPEAEEDGLEARLEEILSLVEGAGRVRVLLTQETDGERVLADDSRESAEGQDGQERRESQREAVIVSGSGQEEAVEVSYRYPIYRGAVVAAEGAGSAGVRLELLEAVKAATGLSADAIRIVKLG